jgi:hypothetical protein
MLVIMRLLRATDPIPCLQQSHAEIQFSRLKKTRTLETFESAEKKDGFRY